MGSAALEAGSAAGAAGTVVTVERAAIEAKSAEIEARERELGQRASELDRFAARLEAKAVEIETGGDGGLVPSTVDAPKHVRTRDILASVRKKHPKLFMVGFAAETGQLERHARAKLAGKKLDLIAANLVGRGRAFDRDDNELHVYCSKGGKALGKDSKANLARALADLIAKRFKVRGRQ